MNISKTIIKATLLATCIFWFIIISKNFEEIMLPLFFLSMIPISICCTIVLLFTIVPFFWLKKKTTTNKTIFEIFFPFYAITCFSLCLCASLKEPSLLCFFASVFITTMQSWIWFGKEIAIK